MMENVESSIVQSFFQNIWQKINDLIGKLDFDGKMLGLYATYIEPISELFKWLLLALLIVVIILGVISFIKKTFKVFIVVTIIVALILFFSR